MDPSSIPRLHRSEVGTGLRATPMSPDPNPPPYIAEYIAAMDRTAELGLQTPPRVLASKNCVDPERTLTTLLDYFDRHTPGELVGQTVAINLALMPVLLKTTGVPFQFTIGWMEREGRAHFEHDQNLIARFLAHKEDAWRSEGLPYHIWLTYIPDPSDLNIMEARAFHHRAPPMRNFICGDGGSKLVHRLGRADLVILGQNPQLPCDSPLRWQCLRTEWPTCNRRHPSRIGSTPSRRKSLGERNLGRAHSRVRQRP